MTGKMIEFVINGKPAALEPVEGEMLADLLRNRLNLTGVKVGCNEDECGACTVVIDGEAVLSCNYPALKANGKTITTVEGLAGAVSGRKLHPLQEAFIQYGAVQCGFCIPGQLMTAYALLQHNPDPSEEDIRSALKDTLCRCGGYTLIIGAIQAAAKSLRTGEPVEAPQVPLSTRARNVIGRIVPRPDALDKVTGRAIYTDDVKFEGMLEARVKRAMLPSAIVKRLDVSRARALPGVAAVLTAEDIPGEHNHGAVIPDWPSLVGVRERIRYVGDAVAIVAAETRAIASDALELIEVEYEPLPVVSSAVQARREDAPRIHPDGNLLKHIQVRKGDVETGFAAADVVLEETFNTPQMDHVFLEPECSVARPLPDGSLEIYVGSQIPYADQTEVALALGWPKERVRVIGQTVGGAFGGKEDIAGQIHAALLANATGRPVKLLYDRHESLISHPKRHATQIRVRLGAKKDGRLTAVETELYGDTGAYASLGEYVMTRATTHSSGPYEAPNVRADCYAMYTNNPPAGAFRGFGVTQSAFAIESAMDMLAGKLNIDPVALRRMNALHAGSITNTGQVLRDSVGLVECIDKVSAEMKRQGGNDPFSAKTDPLRPYSRRAWGFAVAFKNTGLGGGALDKSSAEAELRQDGIIEVRTSAAELGQGLPTVLGLIAAEELDQPPEGIHVLLSDTRLTPDGGPTTASRQTFVSGNAVRLAAKALRELIVSELCEDYDVDPATIRFSKGCVIVNGDCLTLQRAAEILNQRRQSTVASYEYIAPETKPLGEPGDIHVAFIYAAQAAEVEVDTRTGEVQVLRVITANDVGTVINPLGLKGQLEGGVIMGIGHALTENFIVNEGQVVTDRLASYRMPSIHFTPEITSFVVEDPTREGPYGAKGVGEIVLIPTIPAITNAVCNAVRVRAHSIPLDQEMILKELEKRGEAAV
ncbi:xanthine dehydrogenase, molybdenum binding subunit apoprotein [Longilinea arvoryzae]|uniref:Xanthine dehydrogenase, molybdenum binding subunit apoprotein n=1 Tax=Longilinea arvoryzae TaxID=360412 RepID=A0A0S7B762_9CHLR|nr:molybdopterin cofactor-binding domain-containing protein [Longilinea arvoryzae]GAP13135.1 xanthine dehydrogenase, molybdenum binding subunit apoprotein [Longilinea arvoryzae]